MTETVKLILTVDETNTVLAGLQELKFSVANPLIQKILGLAKAQMEEESEPEE